MKQKNLYWILMHPRNQNCYDGIEREIGRIINDSSNSIQIDQSDIRVLLNIATKLDEQQHGLIAISQKELQLNYAQQVHITTTVYQLLSMFCYQPSDKIPQSWQHPPPARAKHKGSSFPKVTLYNVDVLLPSIICEASSVELALSLHPPRCISGADKIWLFYCTENLPVIKFHCAY